MIATGCSRRSASTRPSGLEASGEREALRRRHAEHFLALAEEAEPHLRGNPKKWADRLEPEQDNIRSALATLEASGETELALRLAGAMAPFWYLRNHAVEGRRSLEAVLIRDDRRTAARAKALAGVAVMAFADADLDVSAEYAEDALALHREFGDRKGVAYSAMLLGNALGEAQPASQMARAQKLLEESVDGFREVGDVESELRAAYNLATVVSDPGRERAILEDNMRRARALGLERDESMALGALAGFARREGRTDEAVSMLARCIRIERNIGDLAWTAINLGRLAAALASGGKLVPAACLLGNAEGLREKVGLRRPLWATEINDETHTAIRAELDDARFAEAFEEGRRLTIDDAITLALDAVDRERSTLEESETSGG